MEGEERLKERQTIPDRQAAILTSKGFTSLVLGNRRRVDLHTCQSLKMCIEALIAFPFVYRPDGLNNAQLSQDCILKIALAVETVGGTYIPSTGEALRSF